MNTPKDILRFWFQETTTSQKFVVSKAFDKRIARKFGELHKMAVKGGLQSWRSDAWGSLSEIIVLDQFSRHIYRGTKKAFASDKLALQLSTQAIRNGFDAVIPLPWLSFLYMPYMHSESKAVHKYAVKLFKKKGLEESYRYELMHKAIIDRFGRYPHRNAALGRLSTQAELIFLTEPGSSF
jgi:uncharacterized protein (DUF924 family)